MCMHTHSHKETERGEEREDTDRETEKTHKQKHAEKEPETEKTHSHREKGREAIHAHKHMDREGGERQHPQKHRGVGGARDETCTQIHSDTLTRIKMVYQGTLCLRCK